MKKQIYIFLTMVFWVLLAVILYGLADILYIGLLAENFSKYSLGLSWDGVYMAQYIFMIFLAILGIIGGYFLGQSWWRIIYVEKRRWRFKRNHSQLIS